MPSQVESGQGEEHQVKVKSVYSVSPAACPQETHPWRDSISPGYGGDSAAALSVVAVPPVAAYPPPPATSLHTHGRPY